MKLHLSFIKKQEVITFIQLSCAIITFGCLLMFGVTSNTIDKLQKQVDKIISTSGQSSNTCSSNDMLIKKYQPYVGNYVGIIYTRDDGRDSTHVGTIRDITEFKDKISIVLCRQKEEEESILYAPTIVPLNRIQYVDTKIKKPTNFSSSRNFGWILTCIVIGIVCLVMGFTLGQCSQ